MGKGRGRWLLPLAASAAVTATLLGPELVTAHADRGGSVGPDRTSQRLPLPAPGVEETRDTGPLRITGYQADGRDLTVFYQVAPRSDCSTKIGPPGVRESASEVAVHLVRAPTGRPEETCSGQRLSSSVALRLDRPWDGRVLRDVAQKGALVTPFHGAP